MSMSKDYQIAIVGPADTITGFTALGVRAFPAHTADEALAALRTIKLQTTDPAATERYAVVCIIEELVAMVDPGEYSKIVAGPLPAVVLLPGPKGTEGFALTQLRRLAERAVGSAVI